MLIEQGEVIEIKDNTAIVRLMRSSACGNCGMCGMTEEQKHIDVQLPNTLFAVVGDVVKLEISESASIKASLIIYLIPLALAVAAMLIAFAFSLPDWSLVVVFVIGLVAGFLIVRLADKKYSKKLNMIPKMIEIIKENNNE